MTSDLSYMSAVIYVFSKKKLIKAESEKKTRFRRPVCHQICGSVPSHVIPHIVVLDLHLSAGRQLPVNAVSCRF